MQIQQLTTFPRVRWAADSRRWRNCGNCFLCHPAGRNGVKWHIAARTEAKQMKSMSVLAASAGRGKVENVFLQCLPLPPPRAKFSVKNRLRTADLPRFGGTRIA